MFQQLSSRLEENSQLIVDTEEDAVKKMFSEDYALFSDTTAIRYVFMGSCDITEIPVGLFPNFGRLGYIKNLPYAGVFNLE